MKTIIRIFLLFSFFPIHSQNELEIELIDDIEKNILAYRISMSNINLNECRFGQPIDFDRLLPGKNQSLDYSFNKSNLIYSNPNVILYEIKTKFNFIEEIRLRDGRIIKDEVKFYTSDKVEFEEIFLIGYNKINKSIIYVSGSFFKNCISDNFNLNERDIKTFTPFLELKLFSYKAKNIEFKKRKKSI